MLDKGLLKVARIHYRLLLTIAGLGLVSGLLAVIQAYCVAAVIDGAFLQGLGLAELKGWLCLLPGVVVMRAASMWMTEAKASALAGLIKTRLRLALAERLFALEPYHIKARPAGELANLFTEGIGSLDAYFGKYLPQLAASVLIPAVVLAAVFPLDAATGFILLVTAPLIPVFMLLIGRTAERLSKRQWAVLSRLSAHFFDVLRGLETLKAFGRSKEQTEIIAGMTGEFRDISLRVLRIAFLSAFVLELVSTLGTAVVAVTVGLRLLYGQIAFAEAFFLLLLAPEFYLPLRNLGSHFHSGLSARAAAEKIFEILAAVPAPAADGGDRPPVFLDAVGIAFENVHVSYPGEDSAALKGVSFKVVPGEKLALAGPSGAGKSTVVNILLGFIQPSVGTVRINGVPLSEIDPAAWRTHVAYVPQTPHLFYGSVADNIRMARPEASFDEVVEAARAAAAHEFILRLPLGYETFIGDGGTGLSGGERQRIAIARAFLRRAPVLILDEATTALDPRNDRAVQEALARLAQGKTVITVAHRLSTARQADCVLVMDSGIIAERGTHAELLNKDGLYRRLVAAGGET